MAGVLCVDTVYSCCTRRFQLLRLWIDEIPEVLFTIQCNTKHHPSVVLLIMLYEVVLTFESVDEILWCGHSNESYWAVLSCGTVYYAVQGGSYFWVCGWNSKMFSSKWKLLSSTVAVVLRFILLYKVVLTFESVEFSSDWKLFSSTFAVALFILLFKVVLTSRESLDEILISDHSNERCWAVLSSGTVNCAV